MNFFSLLQVAWQSLITNKWRAFLTMLGIIIGVAGVIMILAVGAGAQSLILNEVTKIGSNMIAILPGASDDSGPPASAMGINVTTLKIEDIDAIRMDKSIPEIISMSGYVRGVGTLQRSGEKVETTFMGVEESLPSLENFNIISGRFFNEAEDKSLAKLIVLGHSVANDLFVNEDPIGKNVRLKKENFKVIGVAEERGSAFFSNQDEQVYIPLRTAQKLLLGINHLSMVRLKIKDETKVDQAIADIKYKLRDLHDLSGSAENDFSVRSQAQALDVLGSITDAIKFFLAAMAAIALIVGGIGIMNIMLVSVTERTKEIGLRKAVGAPRIKIIWQFLLEAIVITFVGGLIGIVIGVLMAGIIAIIANYLDYDWDFIIGLDSILVSVGIAIAIGVFFGLYPAWQASKLDPVEALRYE